MCAKHTLDDILKYTANNSVLIAVTGSCNENASKEYAKFRQWFLQKFDTDHTITTDTTETAFKCSLMQFANYFIDDIHTQAGLHLQLDLETATDNNELNVATEKSTSFCNANSFATSTPVRHVGYKKQQQQHNVSAPAAMMHKQLQPKRHNNNNNSNRNSMTLADFLTDATPIAQRAQQTQHAKKQQQQQLQKAQQQAATKVKRVQPLTVSRTLFSNSGNQQAQASTLFGSSTFSHDNNIVNISKNVVELESENVSNERQLMQQDVQKISKLIKSGVENNNDNATTTSKMQTEDLHQQQQQYQKTPQKAQQQQQTIINIDLKKIKNIAEIQLLAAIYCILLELNFMHNILQELAFLYNLLNSNNPYQLKKSTNAQKLNGCDLLQQFDNSIYFVVLVLQQQSKLFAYADVKTLHTLLRSERLQQCATELHEHLLHLHDKKQQLASVAQKLRLQYKPHNYSTVYVHEQMDLRQHFPSMHEFHAYKKQRDCFYDVLKYWESQHLHPNWHFEQEAGHKIQDIFRLCEHPVNMLHLAKLFVSQLLICHNYTTATPVELGLNINMDKFHLLTQRLVNAEHFNMDYDFPGHQLFFCEFALIARSIAFIEQLKLELYARLLKLDTDISAQFNVHAVSNCLTLLDNNLDTMATEHNSQGREYVVRAETLSNMLILAKFLGYVMHLPYIAQKELSLILAKEQLKLRSQLISSIDMHNLLVSAILERKILITLPWLVQYLAMLDDVELRLPQVFGTLHLMFSMLFSTQQQQFLTHATLFVLRCCLGWLSARQPIVAAEFMRFKCNWPHGKQQQQQIQLLQNLCSQLEQTHMPVGDCAALTAACGGTELASILDEVIKVACPALAQFRADIMRSTNASCKSTSRSGRYRHITTRYITNATQQDKVLQTADNALEKPEDGQQRLRNAFLEQQSPCIRRLLDFLTKHIITLVECDIEQQLLAPTYNEAEQQASSIHDCNYEKIYALVEQIYVQVCHKTLQKYDELIEQSLHARIEQSLIALLPNDVSQEMRVIYANFIKQTCKQRLAEYRQTHIDNNHYITGYVKETAQRVLKRLTFISDVDTTASTELQLSSSKADVSIVLKELSYWLHMVSMRHQQFQQADKVIEFLEQRVPAIFQHKLPTVFYRLLAYQLLVLAQQFIINLPQLANQQLFTAICNVLRMKDMRMHNKTFALERACCINEPNAAQQQQDDMEESDLLATVHSEDDTMENAADAEKSERQMLNVYMCLVTIPFIRCLNNCEQRFQIYETLLITCLNAKLFSVDFINQRFLSIFKEDWSVENLNLISMLLRNLALNTSNLKRSNSNKSNLFLDLLADISTDKEFI